MNKNLISVLMLMLSVGIYAQNQALPRGNTPGRLKIALPEYLAAVSQANQDLHSIMVVQNGKVVAEHWQSEGRADLPHVLHSVSKSFTSTAVGFAVAEGKLKVTDKVISFFPDKLPEQVSDNLREMEVRHLLTMNSGHDVDPTGAARNTADTDWVQAFLAAPVTHKPGTYFVYNSLATYMLSAIVQKVTGQKIVDYLMPRLFQPLGIDKPRWDESPQGINCGGWGLYLKTEDLAKTGLLYLQKGVWNGKRLLPAKWVETATSKVVPSVPSGMRPEDAAQKLKIKESDWTQGYGYQFWQCRHDCFRADGAAGQYIIMVPKKQAVIVVTAKINDMQAELNLIWDYIWAAL